MNQHERMAYNAGIAAVIGLAERTADIIAAEGDMTGLRDQITVKALRTLAREAAGLSKPAPVTDEEA